MEKHGGPRRGWTTGSKPLRDLPRGPAGCPLGDRTAPPPLRELRVASEPFRPADRHGIRRHPVEPIRVLVNAGVNAEVLEAIRAVSPRIEVVTGQELRERPELIDTIEVAYGGVGRE